MADAEDGRQPDRKTNTVLRIIGLFLPHFGVLLGLILSTAIYSVAVTGRVAIIYPLLRVFATDAPPSTPPDAPPDVPPDAQPGGETGESTGVQRVMVDSDNAWSPTLRKLNETLDRIEAAILSTVGGVLPASIRDDPTRSTRVAAAIVVALSLILITIASAFGNFFKLYFGAVLGLRVLVNLRVRLLENLLHQPLAFYNEQKRGELISRMSADVGATTACIGSLTGPLLLQPLMVLMPVLFIVSVQWWLFPIVAGFLFIIARSLLKQTRKVHRRARVRQRTTARVTEAMVQMFSGIRIVKAFGLEGEKVDQYNQRNLEFSRDAIATEIAKALTRVRMELLTNLALLLGVIAIAVLAAVGGEMPTGALIAFVVLMGQVYRPMKQVTQGYTDLIDNTAGAERTFEFLDLKPGLADKKNAPDLTEVEGNVRFEKVNFSYDGNGQVLHDINLSLPTGEVAALVGHSGAGKSTLVNLVPRFYDIDSGSITIDDTDIRDVTRSSLLANIAIVTQEPFLFNTTIYENISHGKPNATFEEIEAAAQAANIHEFIAELPRGYETVVGDQGAKLSGGQRQRITIARALLRDARILILDEATSSLDTESERAVQKALENLMQGRTTLVIAHRLSTVQHADKICVMQDGRIIETGTHDALMARESHYRHLYELQFRESDGA